MAAGTPSLESLLAEEGWVRAIAWSLLSDPDSVDEVVQQTWIAAWRRPPGRPGSVRAWLASVARNFALRAGRGEGRRATREHTVARPEAGVPSPAEIVEREATRRRVVEAVLALEDPYRSAVLLRYFEDLPPKEIARRLGVPDATARTHLRRGLDRLRERLDRENGGDPRAWGIALIPLAGPPDAGAGAAALAGGGLAMSGLVKVSAGAAAVVLTAAATFWATRGPGTPPAPAPPARQDPPVARVDAPARTGPSAGSPAAADPGAPARHAPPPPP
ncbi:MAG: sigma-70 family RNA polymerase sigma factor, partial [Planctomycetales bacterium]|nr:sigma-70 family RNA polymerase sigma factor [Planctomycetales bacterium]